MISFFKSLDSLVDRWLLFKINAAVDERFFIEEHIRLKRMTTAKQFNISYWLISRKTIYKYYKLGEFDKAAYTFKESIKNAIQEFFMPEMKSTISKFKKEQIQKPPHFKCSDFLTDYEIRKIEKEALKSIKDYIVINEAARKAKIKYFDDQNKWIENRRNLILSNEVPKFEKLSSLINSRS